MIVLDLGATLSLVFEDEDTARVEKHLRDAERLVQPACWPTDVTEGLIAAERAGVLSRDHALRAWSLIERLPVTIAPALPLDGAWVLRVCAEHGISGREAAYVELALREGLPLLARDKALRKAARACGVITPK